MSIQWYPGHMYKASKAIRKGLPQIDLIIEVLDARIPFSSQNPMLSKLRGDKPCIRVLSKADLADPVMTHRWQLYLEQEEAVKTLAMTTQKPDKIKQIKALLPKMIPEKGSADKLIKTMIMGIPNVGKSTIVNILADRMIAKTGNEPAVTKQQQRIKLDHNIVLSDTPGVLWGNVEHQNSGYRLAATGAIKDTAMEYVDVACFIADYLIACYPQQLKLRYQLDNLPNYGADFMELIGKKRGCLRSGKQVDLDKTAKILIAEFRAGIIGNMTLETPEMMKQEKHALSLVKDRKEAKKKARKQKWKETKQRT